MANQGYPGSSELSAASIQNGLAALKQDLEAKSKVRQDSRALIAAKNRAMAKALEEEFSKAGIDTRKIEAVGLTNMTHSRKEMEQYRQMKSVPTNPRGAHLPGSVAPSIDTSRTAPISVIRTPPFDIADGHTIPANPAPAFGFTSFSTQGGMTYFVDSAPQLPSRLEAHTFMGVLVPTVLGDNIFTVPGIVTAVSSVTLSMVGSASCQFAGYGHTEGSLGWIVMALDSQGNFIETWQQDYTEQYYIDVNFGQSQRIPVGNPSFSQSISFLTLPDVFYQVYVWQWGEIEAEGETGPSGSQAAGFGMSSVNSIVWTWSPLV